MTGERGREEEEDEKWKGGRGREKEDEKICYGAKKAVRVWVRMEAGCMRQGESGGKGGVRAKGVMGSREVWGHGK